MPARCFTGDHRFCRAGSSSRDTKSPTSHWPEPPKEDGAPREAIELSPLNHAPLLDPSVDLDKEYMRYSSWVRSSYAHVVDALSGERLDIMLQCVKLRVEGSAEHLAAGTLGSSPLAAHDAQQQDAFDIVMREVSAEGITIL